MHISTLYQLYVQHPIICTDSRKITDGCIFIALKGERFDGNSYAAQALEDGAAYAVIDNAEFVKDERYVLVDDGLEALQELARYHRRQFKIPFVGITGSNGKTTTKELVGAVLDTHFKTIYTKGNFNNHIGVPLTLLEIPLDAEMAVIEMGANHQKEIALLSSIAAPTVGIITNVGKAHLEGFGGVEGVKKGKSELYEFLATHQGTALVNLDQNDLLDLALGKNVERILTYGQDERADYKIDLVNIDPFVKVSITDEDGNETVISSHLIGQYNYHNISTAIAIGLYFELSLDKIKAAIESYIPSNNRSQIIQKNTNTYVLDAYNANPTSTQHALQNFAQMNKEHKVAIIGDMLELGEASYAEHLAIASLAKSLPISQVILVGREYKKVTDEVALLHFDTVDTAKEWLELQSFENTAFLIKGSRGIKLEKLLQEEKFRLKSGTVLFNEKKVAYRIYGQGFPLVLIHGYGEDQTIWNNFLKPLTKNYQVITIDLPGFGLSDVKENMSIAYMAEAVNAVLEELNIHYCTMIGHSMGGYTVLAFAELYANKLKGLGLFHSHPFADSAEKKINRQRGMEFVEKNGSSLFIRQMIPNLFAEDYVKANPKLIEKLTATASKYDPQGIIEGARAMKDRPDRSEVLEKIQVPVLFIIGKQDKAVSWEQSMKQTSLPSQSAVHILDIGHMGMFEAKEDTQQIILDFLEQ